LLWWCGLAETRWFQPMLLLYVSTWMGDHLTICGR